MPVLAEPWKICPLVAKPWKMVANNWKILSNCQFIENNSTANNSSQAMTTHFNVTWFWFPLEMQTIASSSNKLECVSFLVNLCACVISVIRASFYMFSCVHCACVHGPCLAITLTKEAENKQRWKTMVWVPSSLGAAPLTSLVMELFRVPSHAKTHRICPGFYEFRL